MMRGLFRRRGPQAVEQYGAPGSGSGTAVSVVTIFAILGGWWLVHPARTDPAAVPAPLPRW